MKSAALSRVAVCVVAASLGLAATPSAAQSCKCHRPPGGGVQCAENQIAMCDPLGGECNCTCRTVEKKKTKAEYEAVILSGVLDAEVDPAELSTRYEGLGFREDTKQGTVSLDFSKIPKSNLKGPGFKGSDEGLRDAAKVKIGLPEWLKDLLIGKGGVSVGPGASLQNCPNGICIWGDNKGTATVNNFGTHRPLVISDQQAISIASQLSVFRGEPLDVDIENPSEETAKFAEALISAFTKAGLKVTRNEMGVLVGGCMHYAPITFMGGVNRLKVVSAIWGALVSAKVVEEGSDGKIPGCSRSGEPNELHIEIFRP